MTSVQPESTAARLHGTVLLVGPGWLGQVTAERLAALGATVATLQRSATTSTNSDVVALTGNIADAARGPERLAALQAVVRSALPAPVDHLVVCIAPSRASGDDYGVYPAAAAGAAALAQALEIKSVLYVSSTGVYDRHDGGVVTEQSAIEPRDARVQALYDAEQRISAVAMDLEATVRIVRAAGLYGPQRDPAARLADPAFAAGDVWCNFSWRDDVVSAIVHLLQHERAPGVRVFNCADGTPLRSSVIAATLTGRPINAPVERAALDGAALDGAAPVRSGRSNQRINVDALLATGWRPVAPTVFDGLRLLGHLVPFASAAE
ncbi:NAD-dependent epimerase/dehydratase family protein [Gemmatimonas groenlandica]|uniref:NAD-dependent epimerase/dehydratase family protein n=1 Tax=Gemmatimonas groenlandica TaxID=2732249 RepID=A0A6M4ILA2_9BACT|nr:NAD-dependent epimerase/dehydratase family protein [Gemmatimonas groenlandica]QJR34659.1 NAD-dependent epimerase/dehydratase family protein [Gemmatimonas groenlandica]